MNALADALKPLAASGPKLLAALSRIEDVSDREALAEAVGAALAEQASRVGKKMKKSIDLIRCVVLILSSSRKLAISFLRQQEINPSPSVLKERGDAQSRGKR